MNPFPESNQKDSYPLPNPSSFKSLNSHMYIPREEVLEPKFDNCSEGNSSQPNFSPLFSRCQPSNGHSPLISRLNIPGHPTFPAQEVYNYNSFQSGLSPQLPFNSKLGSNIMLNKLSESNFRELPEPGSIFNKKAVNKNTAPLFPNAASFKLEKSQPNSIPTINQELPIDSEDDESHDKRRLNKGLKMLSVIVRDIVVEKQLTTYKEVADIILRDSVRDEQFNTSHKPELLKEEQNIKRRVYDALNVLISAGILVKEGKKVRKNENLHKIKINQKRSKLTSHLSILVF